MSFSHYILLSIYPSPQDPSLRNLEAVVKMMGQIESTVINKSMYGSTIKCRNVIGAKEAVKIEKAKQDEKKKTKDLYKSECK